MGVAPLIERLLLQQQRQPYQPLFDAIIPIDQIRWAIASAASYIDAGTASVIVVLYDEAVTHLAISELKREVKHNVHFLNTKLNEPVNWSAKPVFVYACGWSTTGLPYVRQIVDKNFKFISVGQCEPKNYVDRDAIARHVLETEYVHQVAAGFQKWDFGPGDFINICQFINATRNIRGSYVEIGCFQGSSAGVALRYMREAKIARDCWFLDVFDGFTYELSGG